jgi:two-component system sensor histidine kinase UhpB
VRDITDQKRMEYALRQEQKRHSLAAAAGRVGVWDWNLETNDIYVDPELKALIGYRDDEIRNHLDDWGSHVHPEDGEAVMAAAQNYLEGRAPAFEVEHRMVCKDGTVCWFLARGALIVGDDAVRRIVGTDTDITELKRTEEALRRTDEALRDSHARIEDLAGRLIVAQEEERKHVARELHDDLNQQVAALALGISRLKQELPDAAAGIHEQLAGLWRATELLSERIRKVSHELHSIVLQHVGLSAALTSYCDEFSDREGIAVTLHVRGAVDAVTPEAALCLYRVAQESLRNIARHSRARSAMVELSATNGTVELRITDRGVGFDPGEAREGRGLGLLSIEERVKLLNGSLELSARPGAGTELKARIPLN